MHRLLVVVLDAVVVLVFAVLGRRSHEEGGGLTGIGDTAWPFVVGLLLAHLAVRGSATWRSGLLVWVCTLVVGMVLRQLSGDGTAFSFVLVATGFLGVGLVGWRLAALAVRR